MKRSTPIARAAVAVLLSMGYVASAQETSSSNSSLYVDFSTFCTQHFGAKHDPLTYKLPGEKLGLLADGAYERVSEDSAVVSLETNLPATSYIEYGPTAKYGSKTTPTDRPYYLHTHYLKGLKTGAAVHYRLVATDERGQTIMSADRTITPKKIANAVYIPGGQVSAPVVLNKAGATYVLKSDLIATGTALSVTAANVTIDLNGYTVTYNEAPAAKDPNAQKEFGMLATEGVQGVRCGYAARGSTKLYNGTIKQGAGNGGYGSIPVLFRGTEIAGVTLDYYGPQVSGIDGENGAIQHNVFIDRGEALTNRHQGVQAIAGGTDVHHNLIARCRQRGVNAQSNAKIYRNEIYVDSCATNSFGIMMYKSRKCTVTENKIFGTGYLAIGIGTVSEGVGDITVSKNFIHMQAREPDKRWAEYGEQSGAYCVRVTWGGENIDYVDNVMISKGKDAGMVRGIWFCPTPKITNVSFKRNTVKVLCENEASTKWGAIVISGEDKPDSKPGLFEDNTVISNFCHVRFGEEYGTGKNARFVNNTFIKEGNRPDYATVICGFHTFNNNGSVFLNTTLKDGADFNTSRFEGTGENEFKVGKLEGGNEVIESTHNAGSPPAAQ